MRTIDKIKEDIIKRKKISRLDVYEILKQSPLETKQERKDYMKDVLESLPEEIKDKQKDPKSDKKAKDYILDDLDSYKI